MSEARAFINPRMQNYHTLKAGLGASKQSVNPRLIGRLRLIYSRH